MWFLLWCSTDELILKKRVIKDSLQSVYIAVVAYPIKVYSCSLLV